MDSRNLEKALELYAKLIAGENVSKVEGKNSRLYEEYSENPEVYEILNVMLKKLNLSIYEYEESLYVTAGQGNRVFGYQNEELKRSMGVRLNKELYLCYFIIYQVLLSFYSDSATISYKEYVKLEEIATKVTESIRSVKENMQVLVQAEVEEDSFLAIALLWDEVPYTTGTETMEVRASKASKAGYVKLVFNFLKSQELFIENNERYYPTKRFRALAERYFEENRGTLYELFGGKQDA